MKLPYLLIAENDSEHRSSFATIFEKQVAYAEVSMVADGESLLSFLSGCDWKDLPSLIVLSVHLSDMTAPDVLRELLLNERYLRIQKLVLTPAWDVREVDECRILGVKHFLKRAEDVLDLEENMRKIDDLLKVELSRI